jgi:hypothetical protein
MGWDNVYARSERINQRLDQGQAQNWGRVKKGMLDAEIGDLNAGRKEIKELYEQGQDTYPVSVKGTMRRAESHLKNLEFMLGIM